MHDRGAMCVQGMQKKGFSCSDSALVVQRVGVVIEDRKGERQAYLQGMRSTLLLCSFRNLTDSED